MKTKRAFIFAVTYQMPITVYFEEVGTTENDAREKVLQQFHKNQNGNPTISNNIQAEAFKAEAKTESKDHYFIGGKLRVYPGDPASSFHSMSECKLCQSVAVIPLPGDYIRTRFKRSRKIKGQWRGKVQKVDNEMALIKWADGDGTEPLFLTWVSFEELTIVRRQKLKNTAA